MQQSRLSYLFKRYTDKECTAEEYSELMALINKSGDRQLHQLLEEAYIGSSDDQLPDEAGNRILQNIFSATPVRSSLHKLYWLGGIAATVILAVSLFLRIDKNNHTISSAAKRATVAKTIQSANDHRLVRLADGSTVILNKNSYLTYTRAFNSKRREVTLSGEGYFDIKHDPSKPFLVHAGKITVTVLGTAFNINTTKKIAVTVTRGKVSVSVEHKLIGALTPGQQISYDENQEQAQRAIINANQVVKWQASDLFFDNVSMQDAAETLENRFNKTIRFENDKVKKCVFSGAFTHGEHLVDMLKVICAFNKATFREEGNTIIINGEGC